MSAWSPAGVSLDFVPCNSMLSVLHELFVIGERGEREREGARLFAPVWLCGLGLAPAHLSCPLRTHGPSASFSVQGSAMFRAILRGSSQAQWRRVCPVLARLSCANWPSPASPSAPLSPIKPFKAHTEGGAPVRDAAH